MQITQDLNFANLFVQNALKRPGQLALEDGVRQLTYGQLDGASSMFSNLLIQNGLTKGDHVLLHTHKDVATIVAIFGILKAGGIYVPVDVDAPVDRLDIILEETNPKLFITYKTYEGVISLSPQEVIDIMEKEPLLSCKEPDVDIREDDYCYVIYTSGSTGRPKGVPITHGNIAAFMEGMESVFVMPEGAVCMNTLPFHFDGSIVDAFYPLYRGASVYITPGLTIPSLLVQVLLEKKITHFTASASILALIAQICKSMPDLDLSHLDYIMTGADVCDKSVINYFLDVNSSLRIINGYGPTEATCDALTYTISEKSHSSGYFPIGKPMKNMGAVLWDKEGRLTNEKYAEGELLLFGKQLFHGYLKRPDESNKVLRKHLGRHYYHTGDICRIDENGDFHFMGRADDEIKLNGYRIHLSEIKSAMSEIMGVKDAEVGIVQQEKDKFISVAFQREPEGADVFTYSVLVQSLRKKLPGYMLPKAFVEFDQFPLLSTSKTDKKSIRNILNQELKDKRNNFYRFSNDEMIVLE